LTVDPDHRHRGVAKGLVEKSEKTLRGHTIKIFCSLIGASNKASKALFKKCGHTEHRDISYFSKRGSDAV